MPDPQEHYPNVVIFGTTGAGKSSVINMLPLADDEQLAGVSGGLRGVTSKTESYKRKIGGRITNIFDTAGLNEHDGGTVTPRQALENLFRLTKSISGGLSLLILVLRGPRVTNLDRQNYVMFRDIICNGEVPVVLIVTGLEKLPNMDEWWTETKDVLVESKMDFAGHACITASRGPKFDGAHIFESQFQTSKTLVAQLVADHIRDKPWFPPRGDWHYSLLQRPVDLWASALGKSPKVLSPVFQEALASYEAEIGPLVVQATSKRSIHERPFVPKILICGDQSKKLLQALGLDSSPSSFDVGEKPIGDEKYHFYHSELILDSSGIRKLYKSLAVVHFDIQLLILATSPGQLDEKRTSFFTFLYQEFLSSKPPAALVVFEGSSQDSILQSIRAEFEEKQVQLVKSVSILDSEGGDILSNLVQESCSRASVVCDSKKPPLFAILRSLPPWSRLSPVERLVLSEDLTKALEEFAGLKRKPAIRKANKVIRSIWASRGRRT